MKKNKGKHRALKHLSCFCPYRARLLRFTPQGVALGYWLDALTGRMYPPLPTQGDALG
jgi:hypothetical protein